MGKKNKVYDSQTGEVWMDGATPPGPQPSQELLDGFYETFLPCDSERMADEVFTMGKLREYFQCYVTVDPRWGDLLPEYLAALASKGYKMRTSYTGEPAVFVLWNSAPMKTEDEDYD